jgi:8-oxo-dGTP pyrophosphatase MutT (NUDIX family)/mannose-6-phosphate isomerase-like protein (cupin superfamily)
MTQKVEIDELPITDTLVRQKRLIQERGELALIEDGKSFRHLAYFSLRKGAGFYRGGHYHTKKIEHFYVVSGRLLIELVDLESGKRSELRLHEGQRVTIHPYCAHRFVAEEEAQVIEYCDSVYDPEDDVPYKNFPAGEESAGGTADELVTIVDHENNVVGAVPRQQMRVGRLPHRATYILVFNSQGQLYVQKRTRTKDVYPGYYETVAGGVVLAGESYEDGAVRELEEELGISGIALRRLFDFYYEDKWIRVWGEAFFCEYDGEMTLQEEEVESGAFLSISEVMRLAETEPFTPDGLHVLTRYLEGGMSAC